MRDLSVEDTMKRYPRITAHIIAESLGYATPSRAARILKDDLYASRGWTGEESRDPWQEFHVKTKRIYQKDLTSECWPVQVWGLPYCSGFGDYGQMCEFLATEECGGQSIRKKILRGEYSLNGLPDACPE